MKRPLSLFTCLFLVHALAAGVAAAPRDFLGPSTERARELLDSGHPARAHHLLVRAGLAHKVSRGELARSEGEEELAAWERHHEDTSAETHRLEAWLLILDRATQGHRAGDLATPLLGLARALREAGDLRAAARIYAAMEQAHGAGHVFPDSVRRPAVADDLDALRDAWLARGDGEGSRQALAACRQLGRMPFRGDHGSAMDRRARESLRHLRDTLEPKQAGLRQEIHADLARAARRWPIEPGELAEAMRSVQEEAEAARQAGEGARTLLQGPAISRSLAVLSADDPAWDLWLRYQKLLLPATTKAEGTTELAVGQVRALGRILALEEAHPETRFPRARYLRLAAAALAQGIPPDTFAGGAIERRMLVQRLRRRAEETIDAGLSGDAAACHRYQPELARAVEKYMADYGVEDVEFDDDLVTRLLAQRYLRRPSEGPHVDGPNSYVREPGARGSAGLACRDHGAPTR